MPLSIMTNDKKIISIITPCFNEEESIALCIETIRSIFEQLPNYTFEHIICDNGSTDRSVEIVKKIAYDDKRIKLIVNTRNFGILNNTYHGVMSSSGDAVLLFMPVDLQDPPELIPEFIKLWESGYEIVYGVRAVREEGFVIKTARKLYYRILSKVSYLEYPPDAGDFQLVDKKVIEAMRALDESQPFMRMMTFDTGFKSIGVPYTWRARKFGVSRNKIFHMFDQGLNGLVSFSTSPIRISMYLGIIIAFLSILYAIFVLIWTVFSDSNVERGIPTIIAAVFFLGGLNLFFIGVVGEYVLATFAQVRKRPLVVVREKVNFDEN